MTKAKKHQGIVLKNLLSENKPVLAPGVFSPLVAMMAEKKGFKVKIIEESPGDEAGIKSSTLMFTGDYATIGLMNMFM